VIGRISGCGDVARGEDAEAADDFENTADDLKGR